MFCVKKYTSVWIPIYLKVCYFYWDKCFPSHFPESRRRTLLFCQWVLYLLKKQNYFKVLNFCKPTIPQYPPSRLQDYSTCISAMLIFESNYKFPFLIQMKNYLHSGDSNLWRESSAFTSEKNSYIFISKVAWH